MTALDYFDTPEDGWEAHEAGYKQADCPHPLALYYGVPARLVGIEPEPPAKAEPVVPPAWATTKREELLRPVLEPAHLEDRPLRTYLLDQPGPLEVEFDLGDRSVWGIIPTGVRRLEQMRATMQEPRQTYRAPKHLGPGTTSTPRPTARRTRRLS